MRMQTFLILWNCELKKDFPELDFGFYVHVETDMRIWDRI